MYTANSRMTTRSRSTSIDQICVDVPLILLCTSLQKKIALVKMSGMTITLCNDCVNFKLKVEEKEKFNFLVHPKNLHSFQILPHQ